MIKRMLMLPISLAAAAGIPFVAVNKDFSTRLKTAFDEFATARENAESPNDADALADSIADAIPSPFRSSFDARSASFGSGNDPLAARETTRPNAPAAVPDPRFGPSSVYGDRPPTSFEPTRAGLGGLPVGFGQTAPQDPRLPDGWPRTPTLGTDLREVIRFDVTPNWIKANWPRVSTGWTEDGLEGFRVPLVTGNQIDSLTGALTFFFDSEHRVQRIRFVGNTGDAAPLVELCRRYFDMEVEPTRLAGFYSRTYHGRPVSVLRVVHDTVLRAEAPNLQLNVVLEINSPSGPFRLSEAVKLLLDADPRNID